jgi:Helicase conserved C-terminal domain/DEAD/DEAH box helicase
MSTKPTLFIEGSLIPNDETVNAEHLATVVPIDMIRDWFRKRISTSGALSARVLILKSSTGSGKSVAVPPMIFQNFYEKGRGSIVVTQPRVLTTVSIVRDQIAASGRWPFLKLGTNLGWQTGQNKNTIGEGLIYMTVGTIAMQLRNLEDSEIIDRYRFILIDEVHETTLELANIILMLKKFMQRNISNPRLPFVVLMSATFDADRYIDYFGLSRADGVPNLIQVAGYAYERIIHWPDVLAQQQSSKRQTSEDNSFTANIARDILAKAGTVPTIAAKVALAIVANAAANLEPNASDIRDILVFLPGEKEIREAAAVIEREKKAKKLNIVVIILTRETVLNKTSDYIMLFRPTDATRIILGTSVAETGLTINTLRHVVDCGYARGIEFVPSLGISGLITKPAPKSRIIQRMGRIGRVASGHYWPLFTRATYDLFINEQWADSEITDISTVLLTAAGANDGRLFVDVLEAAEDNAYFRECNISNVIDVPNVPPFDIVHYSINKLYHMGFLRLVSSDKTADAQPGIHYQMTKMADLAVKLPKISFEAIRIIFGAIAWHLSVLDAVSIAALMHADIRLQKSRSKPIKWSAVYERGLPGYFGRGSKKSGGGDSNASADALEFDYVGGEEALKNERSDIVNRVRLIIADNFLDAIFLLNAMEVVIKESIEEKGDASGCIRAVEAFAVGAGIRPEAIFEFLARRDEIIEGLLGINVRPFMGRQLVLAPEADFMTTVTKFKYVLYESLRQSIATYVPEMNMYKADAGFYFACPEITINNDALESTHFTRKPRKILYDSTSKNIMKQGEDGSNYVFVIDRASALDGFVTIDDKFF